MHTPVAIPNPALIVKSQTSFKPALAKLLIILALPASAGDATLSQASPTSSGSVEEEALDQSIKKVQDPVHMSVPMKIELIDGVDPIAEAAELPAEQAAELRGKLDRAVAKVRDRLHMSAMLEVPDDPAEEAEIAELYRSGWIIEATVEEVEAALKAAAATPSLEDDIAARILAHRASCRYFFKE